MIKNARIASYYICIYVVRVLEVLTTAPFPPPLPPSLFSGGTSMTMQIAATQALKGGVPFFKVLAISISLTLTA